MLLVIEWNTVGIISSIVLGCSGFIYGLISDINRRSSNKELVEYKAKNDVSTYRKKLLYDYEFSNIKELFVQSKKYTSEIDDISLYFYDYDEKNENEIRSKLDILDESFDKLLKIHVKTIPFMNKDFNDCIYNFIDITTNILILIKGDRGIEFSGLKIGQMNTEAEKHLDSAIKLYMKSLDS